MGRVRLSHIGVPDQKRNCDFGPGDGGGGRLWPKKAHLEERVGGASVHVSMASGPLKGPRQLSTGRGGDGENEAAEATARGPPDHVWSGWTPLSTDLKSAHAEETLAIRKVPGGSAEVKNREREGQLAQIIACICERGRNPGLRVPSQAPLPPPHPPSLAHKQVLVSPTLTSNKHSRAGTHSLCP